MMDVPSGRQLSDGDLNRLRHMDKVGFVKYSPQPFTLKSGIQSNVYVFGREDFTDDPRMEWSVGQFTAECIWENSLPEDKQPCLIGIPTAGNAIAQAGAMISVPMHDGPEKPIICHRIMREKPKTHGAEQHQQWVNGDPDFERHTYWWVDNVATDGASKPEAAERAVQQGYPERMPCFILIDRQQGAVQNLSNKGFERIVVGYNLLDITFAFGELKVWPRDTIKAVEEEIVAHQRLL